MLPSIKVRGNADGTAQACSPDSQATVFVALQRFIINSDYWHVRSEAGSMIKKQDNPPDDIYTDLKEIVEEIIRHMPGHERAHIIGYTIISPATFLPPAASRIIADDGYRLAYETIESRDSLFITARLPPGTGIPLHVEIMQGEVRIYLDERAATISTKFPVDVTRSHYTVRNGILDITIMKLKK
jgi:hypothetical protein